MVQTTDIYLTEHAALCTISAGKKKKKSLKTCTQVLKLEIAITNMTLFNFTRLFSRFDVRTVCIL